MSNFNSRENSSEKDRYEDKNIIKMSNNQIRRVSDDIRNKETDRKHIIWDTDRDRKDVILRKNIDKDNKLDAKRNHLKNQSCFVFGSSTPRSINLDNVTTLGPLSYRQHQQSMLSTTPINTYECNDDNKMIKRRPHSMIYTTENTGQNLMTQSLVLLPSPGRRRHPELTPVIPKEKDFLSSKELIVNKMSTGPKRAISMTRLDQLAKPRQRYLDETLRARNSGNYSTNSLSPNNNNNNNSNCMVRSMYNLPTRPFSTGPKSSMRKGMSTSMTHLNDEINRNSYKSKYSKHSANKIKYRTNTADACQMNVYPNSSTSHFNEHTKQISRSLVNLSLEKPTQTPKETRTSKLRAFKQASSLSKSPASKDGQLSSLSRPISSLSGASEASTPSSSVIMRAKTARKPRPVSIAACASVRQNETPTPLIRESRVDDKSKTPLTTAQRPNRARSAGSSSTKRVPLTSNDNVINNTPKPPPPRKPAHVKAAAAARKTAKQQQEHQKEQINDDRDLKNEIIDKPVVNGISKEKINDELIKLEPELKVNENTEELIKLNSEDKILENKTNNYSDDLVDIQNNLIENDQDNKIDIINDVNINSNQNDFVENTDESFVNNLDNDNNSENQLVNIENSSINNNNNNNVQEQENNSSSKKDISVEEYKRILAEKRKQAREQAEREAEQERLRIEQLQREEEERERQFEEESRRLAEEHRKMEQEKFEKAIQEQQIREEEERKRKEEEQRLKIEKEEQEAKAREEAEKARIELEERLRKDEQERLLRKKRVEAIMIRTRKNKETSPNSEGSRSPDLNSNDSPTKNNVLVTHNVFVEN